MSFILASLCVCLLFSHVSPSWADFQVGVAEATITPDPLLPISGGMGPSQPAREKRGELSARAVVMSNGETPIAIVSVDLLGFPSVLGNRAKAKISDFPADHILIAASHTHSAPDCYAFPDGQGGHTGDLEYMQFVCDQIAKVVNQARNRLQPATLRVGTGEVRGRVAYNYYAPDLYDRRASVIQAIGVENQKPIVTLVNYAIHPEVLGADEGICSPDLIGPLRDRIEAQTGGMAMFVNGAQGGMVTADNRDLDRPSDATRGYWHDHRTWDECVRIGHQLADEALRIVAAQPLQSQPVIRCHTEATQFPVDSDTMWAVVRHSPLQYPHNDDRSITTQINLVELGTARILTIPGEALPNIGFYLKRKMGAEHSLLFGLTNDAFGYILTKEDFHSFPRYDYISRVSLGEHTGEILTETALRMLREAGK